MQHLDTQVIDTAAQWLANGHDIWLCTVLSTYGSAPRAPGSMLVARSDGSHFGSLSGGCIEEDFLERLSRGDMDARVSRIRYGESGIDHPQVKLPCGGVLEVLIERLAPSDALFAHLRDVRKSLQGQLALRRRVSFRDGAFDLIPDERPDLPVLINDILDVALIRIAPTVRLIIAGISPVSLYCAKFATALGYEVIVCDPRPELYKDFDLPGVRVLPTLPSEYIAREGCHGATAIIALTHDPRIDDLAMMEAVRTPAFYIGVMGSKRTSKNRAERLARSGGLSPQQIARIRMPIGMDLGSKTPAQIALSAMADILGTFNGKL